MHEEFRLVGTPETRAIEECSEVIKAICKMERFGPKNYRPDDEGATENWLETVLEIHDAEKVLAELKEKLLSEYHLPRPVDDGSEGNAAARIAALEEERDEAQATIASLAASLCNARAYRTAVRSYGNAIHDLANERDELLGKVARLEAIITRLDNSLTWACEKGGSHTCPDEPKAECLKGGYEGGHEDCADCWRAYFLAQADHSVDVNEMVSPAARRTWLSAPTHAGYWVIAWQRDGKWIMCAVPLPPGMVADASDILRAERWLPIPAPPAPEST